MKQVLLIIDIQNDYFKGGAMELAGAEEAALQAAQLMGKFRSEDKPIIFMQHMASEQASFFKPNTLGVNIHQSVAPQQGDMILQKSYPNSFRDTELLALLRKAGIQELIICGMMTHMCVDTTVRAAFDLGFSCKLIGDACATKSLEYDGRSVDSKEVQTSYLAAIDGTFAEVLNTKVFLNI